MFNLLDTTFTFRIPVMVATVGLKVKHPITGHEGPRWEKR